MRFPHVYSEYAVVAILIGVLFVWGFNSYRLGKFQGKKNVLPWVIGGLFLLCILVFLLFG